MSLPATTMPVLHEVALERERQEAKWGQQDHDDFLYSTILMEEVGEAAQAALQAAYEGADTAHVREELIQVAAVAVAWIEAFDRRAA